MTDSLVKLKKSYAVLAGLVLGLIALGGAVRAMNAGLACPDWPLCFGQLIPDFHPQVYFEFIHRAVAGLIALIALFLGVQVLRNPQASKPLKSLVWWGWIILAVQIIMGGLTVLKLLHFGTVTAHLGLGTLFFGIIFWIYMILGQKDLRASSHPIEGGLRAFIYVTPFIVFGQILLGGLVSSNYAGLACTDFPLCQGQWIPPMQGSVAIHMFHRFGAYFTFLAIYLLYLCIRWSRQPVSLRVLKTSRMTVSLVLIQFALGVANIVFKIPPLVTVLHLATAAAIFACTLRMVFYTKYESEPHSVA